MLQLIIIAKDSELNTSYIVLEDQASETLLASITTPNPESSVVSFYLKPEHLKSHTLPEESYQEILVYGPRGSFTPVLTLKNDKGEFCHLESRIVAFSKVHGGMKPLAELQGELKPWDVIQTLNPQTGAYNVVVVKGIQADGRPWFSSPLYNEAGALAGIISRREMAGHPKGYDNSYIGLDEPVLPTVAVGVKSAPRAYICQACGYEDQITTNHLGFCFHYCKGCSWTPSRLPKFKAHYNLRPFLPKELARRILFEGFEKGLASYQEYASNLSLAVAQEINNP